MKRFIITILTCCLVVAYLNIGTVVKAKEYKTVKGNLLIVGGGLGESNREIYQKFIELAGGETKAKIGIVPVASSTLKSSWDFKNSLIKNGIPANSIKILSISNHDFSDTLEDESKWKDQLDSRELAEEIRQLTAVWFVGGDQLRITETLQKKDGTNSGALNAIWDIYRNGAALGGTSAGAAIMSNVMIAGGDSLGALKQGVVTEETKRGNQEYEPLLIKKGLGFFQHGIVDQHFNERSRLARLIVAALTQEKEESTDFAYGIDEDTAMIVNNQLNTIEVVGRNGLAVVDTSKVKQNNDTGIENIHFSYLAPGDKIHYDTKTFDVLASKDTTKGFEYYSFQALPATGVFTPYGRLKNYLTYSLVDNVKMDSVSSYLYDRSGTGYKLIFRKTGETQGYWGYTDGQKDDYSIVNIAMDIVPSKLTFKANPDTSVTYHQSNFEIPKRVKHEDIKGSLVITGGALGSSNRELYERFIELAGGKDKARIGIIPAASGKLTSSNDFKKDLIQYGVKAESIEILPVSNHDFKGTKEDESLWRENRNSLDLAEKIKGLTGVWFVGGDQTLITGSLLNEDKSNSQVLNSIWNIYKNGAVLGGTSAGAAIMSGIMLAGGDSYGALTSGITNHYDGMTQQEGGPLYLEQGLGFFQYGIVDQHFDNKARLGRLVAASYEMGDHNQLAYGVDEDTALIVNNKTKKAEVVGRGGVTLVDLSKVQANPQIPSRYKNVVISYIVPGDTVNLRTNEISIFEGKDETKGKEYYNHKIAPNSGVLSPHGLLSHFISYDLVDNRGVNQVKSYSFNNGTGFEMTFRKTPETNGFWTYKDGQKDDYSVVEVSLDIDPIKVIER